MKYTMIVLEALIFTAGFIYTALYLPLNRTSFNLQRRNAGFAWPAVGQAAIGTLQRGIIANSSDEEKSKPIASIAKVITALVILEKDPIGPGQQGHVYTITRNDIVSLNTHIAEGGSVLPLVVGMKISQYQAMQRMLIASDNVMADILVERVFGSVDAYLSYAGMVLKRLKLTHTNIADASGISKATVSTPSELIIIGIMALKNPIIAGIVRQKHATLSLTGRIINTNILLGTFDVIGIKTGTTSKAGSCLLFAATFLNKMGHKDTIVGVILGNTDHRTLYQDSRILLASAKQAAIRQNKPTIE